MQELGRMVADLFESGEHAEDEPFALDAFALFEFLHDVSDYCFVQAGLLLAQVGVHFRLLLIGQVLYDLGIRLQAAQDEGLGQLMELSQRRLVSLTLYRAGEAPAELLLGAQIPRV